MRASYTFDVAFASGVAGRHPIECATSGREHSLRATPTARSTTAGFAWLGGVEGGAFLQPPTDTRITQSLAHIGGLVGARISNFGGLVFQLGAGWARYATTRPHGTDRPGHDTGYVAPAVGVGVPLGQVALGLLLRVEIGPRETYADPNACYALLLTIATR